MQHLFYIKSQQTKRFLLNFAGLNTYTHTQNANNRTPQNSVIRWIHRARINQKPQIPVGVNQKYARLICLRIRPYAWLN